MVDAVSWVVEFVTANPIATLLLLALLAFVFYGYLFLRKTVKEFRRGMEGS